MHSLDVVHMSVPYVDMLLQSTHVNILFPQCFLSITLGGLYFCCPFECDWSNSLILIGLFACVCVAGVNPLIEIVPIL